MHTDICFSNRIPIITMYNNGTKYFTQTFYMLIEMVYKFNKYVIKDTDYVTKSMKSTELLFCGFHIFLHIILFLFPK